MLAIGGKAGNTSAHDTEAPGQFSPTSRLKPLRSTFMDTASFPPSSILRRADLDVFRAFRSSGRS